MAKFKFFSTSEADKDIRNADAVINPLLVAANITTIEVNGKPVPATSDDVPMASKIASYAATIKAGSADAQVSQMILNNENLAAQAKTAENRAITAEASNGTLTRENEAFKEQIATLQGNVRTLTAENAEVINLRKVANAETGRISEQFNGVNSEISRMCLKHGVLTDLKNSEGQLLASTATHGEKEAAANLIPAADKLKAMGGAVNAAIARTGIPATDIPAGGTSTATASPTMTRAQFEALAPAEQTAFFARKGKLIVG